MEDGWRIDGGWIEDGWRMEQVRSRGKRAELDFAEGAGKGS